MEGLERQICNKKTGAFEGPEKRLEIILHSKQHRAWLNNDAAWERVVKAVGASIISKISNKYINSYLLSESSLFVWNHRILLITCGSTTPVMALPEILKIIKKENISSIIYERKKNSFSQKQTFGDDASYIAKFFKGETLRLGISGESYMDIFYSLCSASRAVRPRSLQLFMYNLDRSAMKIFYKKESKTPRQAACVLGIDKLYPHAVTDAYLFSPYGYSINGIMDNNYFTIHVTPQPEGSYASFDTSLITKDSVLMIKKVLSIFKPEKYSLFLKTDLTKQYMKFHSVITDAVQKINTGVSEDLIKLTSSDLGCAATFLYSGGEDPCKNKAS